MRTASGALGGSHVRCWAESCPAGGVPRRRVPGPAPRVQHPKEVGPRLGRREWDVRSQGPTAILHLVHQLVEGQRGSGMVGEGLHDLLRRMPAWVCPRVVLVVERAHGTEGGALHRPTWPGSFPSGSQPSQRV